MKRIYSLLCIALFLAGGLFAQTPSIKISTIKISDKNVFMVKSEVLKLKQKDDITLEFKVINTDKGYNIFPTLNSQPIKQDLNKIYLSNLREGEYLLEINGTSVTGDDLFPTSIKFIVEKEIYNEASNEYSVLNIILGSLVLIQFIAILFLLKKKEKTKKTVNINELDDLNLAYDTLKSGYKKLENKNKNLLFKIEDLRKNIKLLETANVTLVGQKEKLSNQKLKLEELQKQKDKLFAIAVHDIKNPASAIKGLLELLKSYDLNATEQQEVMESLINSSENILKLTQNISLTIAREEPKPIIQKEKGSLKEIIDTVVAVNAAAASKKGIKLINKSSSSIPDIEFDKLKIEEAIDNFVNNAIKYSPSETEVIVKSYFSTTDVSVEVSDDGVGLSKEDQAEAFKKGVTLTPKPTGGESSSGLGLWIVKTIIEEHEGNVWVKSKLGVGSNFGFSIPIK